MKIVNIFYWGARVVAALIMLQTLFFKFSASAESVYIFTTVGMEPWGRIGVGVFELIAAVLLLVPATGWLGAGLGLGLMISALGMHFTLLGIEVQGDHGYLFTLSLIVAVCSAFVLQHDKTKVFALLKSFQKS